MPTRGGARPGAGRPQGSKRAGSVVVAARAMLAAIVAQQTDYKDAPAVARLSSQCDCRCQIPSRRKTKCDCSY
jgi:hypothetical protein